MDLLRNPEPKSRESSRLQLSNSYSDPKPKHKLSEPAVYPTPSEYASTETSDEHISDEMTKPTPREDATEPPGCAMSETEMLSGACSNRLSASSSTLSVAWSCSEPSSENEVVTCRVDEIEVVRGKLHLHSLCLYPPDEYMNPDGVVEFTQKALELRDILSEVRELSLLKHDEYGDVPCPPPAGILIDVMSFLFLVCKKVVAMAIEWELPERTFNSWSWFDVYNCSRLTQVRELVLSGNLVSPRQLVVLARDNPNLEVLDVRRGSRIVMVRGQPRYASTTFRNIGMRRVLELLEMSYPKLTIMYDDDAENIYGWNYYLNQSELDKRIDDAADEGTLARFCKDGDCSVDNLRSIFQHLLYREHWLRFGVLNPPSLEDRYVWRAATLDSSVMPTEAFCRILGNAPALGLVDCRSQTNLDPRRRGPAWIKSLAEGPKDIRAIRILAKLVSCDDWHLVEKALGRVGCFLERLELDFRGAQMAPAYKWRRILNTLKEVPKVREFVLRGRFEDTEAVFDRLHGRLPCVERLDLRECQCGASDEPAFIESLQKLLSQVGKNLVSLALPSFSKNGTVQVMGTVAAEMAHLSDVTVYVSQLPYLRSFKNLGYLSIYSDCKPSESLARRLASTMRNLSEELKNVKSFIIENDFYRLEVVKDAVQSLVSKICILHVIYNDTNIRRCVENLDIKSN